MFGSSTSSPHIIGVVGRRSGWRWWHKPKCKPPRAAGKRSAYCNSVCSNPVHFSPERPIWRLNVIFFSVVGWGVVVVKLRAETTHAQYCRINCGSALFLFTPNIWSRKCAQSRESSREKRIMRIYRFFSHDFCLSLCRSVYDLWTRCIRQIVTTLGKWIKTINGLKYMLRSMSIKFIWEIFIHTHTRRQRACHAYVFCSIALNPVCPICMLCNCCHCRQ